jgi:hypothetical protein
MDLGKIIIVLGESSLGLDKGGVNLGESYI